MANPKNPDTTTKTPETPDVVTVNLKNPTTARRVIYDGIAGQQSSIVVDPGMTKRNVRLHKSVVTELRTRARDKKDSDLLVLPVSADDEEQHAA